MGNCLGLDDAEPRGDYLCHHCKKLVTVDHWDKCTFCHQKTTEKPARRAVVCPSCGSDWAWPNNESCERCRRGRGTSSLPPPRGRGKTLPSEERRYLGSFVCPNCSRTWFSVNSWVGASQNCLGCGLPVYPRSLNDPEGYPDNKRRPEEYPGNKRRHLRELCQKCQELGYYCRKLDPSPSVRNNRP